MRRKEYRQIMIGLLVAMMVGLGTGVRDPALGAVFAGIMLSAVLAVYLAIRFRSEGEEP
jgi:hypothetical protein